MASPAKDTLPKQLPPPNSDFYELVETLPADELAVVKYTAFQKCQPGARPRSASTTKKY